jgi:hypothetical protein
MKKLILSFVAVMLFASAFAQEEGGKVNVTADLVSRYVWRGTQFSTAPAIQPGISYSNGGFSGGAWGSYALNNVGTECDLFASYTTGFGLGAVVNSYFFPQDPTTTVPAGYFGDNHTLEVGLTYGIKGFSLAAYKYLNQGKDFYAEAGYTKDNLTLFVGGGDQLYSTTKKFNIVNIGLKVSKEVALTDKYTIKPFGSFIVNPNQEQVFLVVGLTL